MLVITYGKMHTMKPYRFSAAQIFFIQEVLIEKVLRAKSCGDLADRETERQTQRERRRELGSKLRWTLD